MNKQNKKPAADDLNANNKKKAFKEGEMNNSVKLGSSSDQKETNTRNSLSKISEPGKPDESFKQLKED